jgi:hypothetical protein
VAVNPGGVLDLFDASVNHSVTSDRARSIFLNATTIGFGGTNGILIQGAAAGTQVGACSRHDVPVLGVPLAIVENSNIAGNVTIDGFVGCDAGIGSNGIGGSVTFTNNRSDTNGGGNQITENTIGGNLFCKMNQPPPTGAPNSIGGTVNPSACSNLVL